MEKLDYVELIKKLLNNGKQKLIKYGKQGTTNALHSGHDVSKTEGTRAVPLYQSTSYVFKNADHAAVYFL